MESKLQARANRQHPLPRVSCEHVVQGYSTVAQIIRDGVLLSVCSQCWTSDEKRLSYDGQPRNALERAAEKWIGNRLINEDDLK